MTDAYRMVQTVGSRNSQPWTPLASSMMATAATPVLLRLLLLLLWGLCKAAAAASAAAAGHVNLLNIEVCCCAQRMAGNAHGPVVGAWPPQRSLADQAVPDRQASQPQSLFPAPADRGVHDHLVLSRLMHAGKAKRRAERLRDEESAAKVRLMASVSDGLILCSKSPFV